MKRKEILEAAEKCVLGERQGNYGGPEYSFKLIANFWSAYLNGASAKWIELTPRDVAAMMALLKIARIKAGRNDDSWVDLAGYAACGGEIDDKEQKTAD